MLNFSCVQIWSAANFSLVGSLSTTLEVRAMALSSELIYLGGKGGCVEIWDREKQNKIIDTLQTGTNCKVLSLALDANEEVLVTGTSDGRIQVTMFSFSFQSSNFEFLDQKLDNNVGSISGKLYAYDMGKEAHKYS